MPEKNANVSRGIQDVDKKKDRSLSLVVTRNCNLRCTYCYEKHDQRDGRIMDISVAQNAITRYLAADDDYDRVAIEFFGGEPMLGFSFIREIIEWTQSRKWKKDHRFLIGTNGTILNDEIKDWLIRHRECVNVAFSIDGTKTAHDMTRDNSYDSVRRNLPFFKDNWPNQPAKMTISAETIPYVAEGVIELEEMGLFFTANVGFEDMWGDVEEQSRLLDIYEEQLSRLVDYYAERPHLFPVYPILDSVPEYLGLPDSGESQKRQKEIKRFCGAGHEMLIIDVDGKTYPCHRFLPWVTARPAPKDPANCQNTWKPDSCGECKLIISCPTCAGYNWEINQDTGIRTTFHCESFKREVLASSRLEAIRLGQRISDIDKLSLKGQKLLKKRLEAVWDLIENGV
jgi:radical SAM protein with 4Fe4S-binding SPASM domain